MFDASEVVSGSWSNTTGVVWQKSLVWSNDTAYLSIWENSNRFPRASSVANCNSTVSSYYVADDTVNPVIVYLHASDGGNPGSNGKTYEYSKRGFGIDGRPYAGITNTTIRGVATRRNAANNGSIQFYGNATDVTAYEGTKHNVLVHSGSTLTNVAAIEAYYPAGGIMFIVNENVGLGESTYFVNCAAAITNSPASVGGIDGFYGHLNVSGTLGVMYYYGVKAWGLNQAIGAEGADSVIVDGRFTNNARAFSGISPRLTAHLRPS